MRSTEVENRRHSTGEQDPMPRLRRRFFGSLVLIGLLIGLMIGRLTAPGPLQLEAVETQPQSGQLQIDGMPVAWRVQQTGKGLLLHLVAARRLQGQWHGERHDGGWRIAVQVTPLAGR
jgi:hypothetical protein